MNKPLRVGMLVASTTTTGGGVPQAVQSLSLALEARGNVAVEVFSLQHDAEHGLDFGDIPLHVAPVLGPRGFSFAPSLVTQLQERNLDCLHVHGIWTYLSVAAQRWHGATGRPYMISPHGMLDSWAMRQRSIKKRAARLFYEDAHLGQAACLHALCDSERNSISALGYAAPVSVIPNGVDAMPLSGQLPAWKKSHDPAVKTLVFLGRVTRKKHVLELLQAWNSVSEQAAAQSWQLVVVGPVDAEYAAPLSDTMASMSRPQSVQLAGPAYGAERAAAYHAADAFILPSVSEGLPMGALEALSCGLPCLLTPECNLPEAFGGAALTISADPVGIAKGLLAMFNMTQAQREAMSASGQALVAEHFTWERSAGLMETSYRQITAIRGRAGAA